MASASRILALLNLLQTHRHWSGANLATRLEVTNRTLRRDVKRLRELGYRIDATRGAAGGYRLGAGTALPPLLFTPDEAVAMAVGLRLAATQGLLDGVLTASTALAKFEHVLPAALSLRVNAIASTVLPQTPRTPSVASDMLGILALACRDRERIRFHYLSGSGSESDRVSEPHSLVAESGIWFLVSWDLTRGNWRTFRLDRMSRVLATRLHFAERALPARDAAEFVAAAVAGLRPNLSAAVIMHLSLRAMREQFGAYASHATAVGANRTRWALRGRTVAELLSSLAWVPEGVAYELEGNDEFIRAASEMSTRLAAATLRSA
ncbi:MAG: YafY family transcriptional regulator [Salinibacterium sp.]|nr:YafY family transcriptional regulator [Salinibacterium sp.]